MSSPLQSNPSPNTSRDPLPEVVHYFRVEYNAAVLLPGQLLPVWDFTSWSLLNSFEAHSWNAVRVGGRLVTAEGHDTLEEAAVKAVAWAQDPDVPVDQDAEALAIRYRGVPLGNIGGRRVVRPNRVPSGALPMDTQRVYGQRTIEYAEVSVLEWVRTMQDIPEVAARPPEIAFFAVDKDGDHEGWDVTSGRPAVVRRLPLPFSWCSGRELGLKLQGNPIGGDQEAESQYLNRLAYETRSILAAEGVTGPVYLGWHLPEAGTGLPDVYTTQLPRKQYLDEIADLEEVYVVPFQGRNPWGVLQPGVRDVLAAAHSPRAMRPRFAVA